MSFTKGTFDGRYIFINDKANTRVARIRCDVMKCDKMIELPNQYTVHGMRPQKFPRTGYVFCNGEYEVPMPNDGKVLDDPKQVHLDLLGRRRRHDEDCLADYGRRQPRQHRRRLSGKVRVLHLLQLRAGHDAGRHDGKGAGLGRYLQHQAYRRGGEKGDFKTVAGAPVIDGRQGSPYTRYVPVSNSPHGINTAPDGIHVVANGKLSPTVTVFDVRLFDQLFDDKIKPREVVVAESLPADRHLFEGHAATARPGSGAARRTGDPASGRAHHWPRSDAPPTLLRHRRRDAQPWCYRAAVLARALRTRRAG